MKTTLLTLVMALSGYCSYAQTNTFPSSGNVGIGTTSPATSLDVNGNGRYTSYLQIGGAAVNSNSTKLFINNGWGDGKNWALSSGANMITEQGFHIYNWTDNSTSPLFTISNAGNVGIGTTGPSILGGGYKTLTMTGANTRAVLELQNTSTGTTGTAGTLSFFNGSTNIAGIDVNADGATNSGAYQFYTFNSGSLLAVMKISSNGNIGIGTTTPDTKLAVNGTIHTKEVKVDLTGWPDYVFTPKYKLLALLEIKKYIDQNKHLPEMPSEAEVAKEGINLGEMNKLLTKKVEELTLYLIEEHDKNTKQEARIAALESALSKLTADK